MISLRAQIVAVILGAQQAVATSFLRSAAQSTSTGVHELELAPNVTQVEIVPRNARISADTSRLNGEFRDAACLDPANRPTFDGMDIRSYEQLKDLLRTDRTDSRDQADDFVCTKDMLPKKLHVVWLNSRMPEKYVRQANENALRNPKWTMYVWVEEQQSRSA
jgi:hypothetical protein